MTYENTDPNDDGIVEADVDNESVTTDEGTIARTLEMEATLSGDHFAGGSLRHEHQTQMGRTRGAYFSFQFDDNFVSVYDQRDFFADNNVKPEIAVNSGDADPDESRTGDHADWSQLRELRYDYGWLMHNHGVRDDVGFDSLTEDEKEDEVRRGKRLMLQNGLYPHHYVYQLGQDGGKDGRAIVAEEYPIGWQTGQGGFNNADPPFSMRRQKIDGSVDISTVKSRIDTCIANNVGMVLYGHKVEESSTVDDNTTLTVTTGTLTELFDYIRTNGGTIGTTHDTLRYSCPTFQFGGATNYIRGYANGSMEVVPDPDYGFSVWDSAKNHLMADFRGDGELDLSPEQFTLNVDNSTGRIRLGQDNYFQVKDANGNPLINFSEGGPTGGGTRTVGFDVTPTIHSPRSSAPSNPEAGMEAIQDGASWDPAGTGQEEKVCYLNGAWVQLS